MKRALTILCVLTASLSVISALCDASACALGILQDDEVALTREESTTAVRPSLASERGETRASDSKAPDVLLSPSVDAQPMTDERMNQERPRHDNATEMTLTRLIPTKKLHNVRVLRAMTRVPRENFLSKKHASLASLDEEIPLEDGRVLPSPFMTAFTAEALDPQPTDRVLIISDQSGYLGAIWSCLTSQVFEVDSNKTSARKKLGVWQKLKFDNICLCVSQDATAWRDWAPFDKILVASAQEEDPEELFELLSPDGALLCAVGHGHSQRLQRYTLVDGQRTVQTLASVDFPPETLQKNRKRSERNTNEPLLSNGDFETLDEQLVPLIETEPSEAATPLGWRELRNAVAVKTTDAYQGARLCRCDNVTVYAQHQQKDRNQERIDKATLPENRRVLTSSQEATKKAQRACELTCSITQSFAISSSAIKKATISGAFRVQTLVELNDNANVTIAKILFFDQTRKKIGEETILATAQASDTDWTEFSVDASVPPKAAYAVLTLGVLDGVGIVDFDAIQVKNKYEKK
ncbi:MAG: hypothetical protein Q4G03_09985 [Planctomycetia bacterium]|nr:hypothetical protein [Planctomycetia bacterium]